MKAKNLLRTLLLLALLVAMVGSSSTAYAKPNFEGDPEVVTREMAYWNTTYTGEVDFTRFEKWPFYFSEEHEFVVTATATSGGWLPLLRLLDASGNELAAGLDTLASKQPSGLYFVQIEPEAGSGSYELTLAKIIINAPSVSTTVDPTRITQGESATVRTSLNELPAEGYSSVEFTCTYPADILSVSNISATDLFGTNPVTALSGPANGSFIFAIAGSNGQRAMTSGVALTFDVTGLQVGNASVECKAKASAGDGLKDVPSEGPVTLNVIDKVGTVNGKVIANKAVTVTLSDVTGAVFATMPVDANGAFSMNALAGTYILTAEASGYLNAENTAVVVVAGTVTDMQAVTLLAGDIAGDEGNPDGKIDQLDAMSIGMNYNGTTPEIADLNADGIINILDLELVATNYGETAPQAWAIAP